MPDSTPFRLEVFRGLDGFRRLKPQWQQLTASMGEYGFYHCAEWYEAHIECLESFPDQFRFYGVSRDGRLAAVFPLKKTVRRIGPLHLHALQLPVHNHMPLRDVILPATEEAGAVWLFFLQELRRRSDERWDFIWLSEIPQNATLLTVLDQSDGLRVLQNRMHACSYCPLMSQEEFSRRLSRHLKRDLRTANNRLKRCGAVSFHTAQSTSEMEQLLAELLRMELSGWKGRMGTAIAQNPRLTAFYQKLIRSCPSCAIVALEVDQTPVAAGFCLMIGETFYGLKLGFDEAFSRCSPGQLLLEQTLKCENFADQGIAVSNFCGETPWARPWNPESFDVYDVFLFRTTVRARITHAQVVLGHLLRRLYRRTVKPHLKQFQESRSARQRRRNSRTERLNSGRRAAGQTGNAAPPRSGF